jgi:glyoxylase-like metal-dependent hydrolase (beta-lactamase superfamily II)
MGDTLLNQGDRGLTLLPDAYIEDKKQLLKSLQKLLELNFKIITFAHGDPIVQDAQQTIARFVKKPRQNTS